MSSPAQRVMVNEQGDVTVLRINIKELVDYDVADEITSEMIEAIGDKAEPRVVVDLGGIEFLSSVGYIPFIDFRTHIRKVNGKLILANMSEMIREVFDATRLLINRSSPKSLFEYRPTVDEAVAELAGR